MGSHSTDPTRQVLDHLRRLVHFLSVSSRSAEKSVGLSGAQLFVLQKLAESPSLSVNDLAERTQTHQSSVSVIVQKLVRRGLVSRLRSKSDARRWELSLTPKGRQLLRRSPPVAQDRLIQAIQRLPLDSRRRLSTLLAQLALQAGIESAPPALFFEDHNIVDG
jgi:DNA-binding MarR family transcriptional regulator